MKFLRTALALCVLALMLGSSIELRADDCYVDNTGCCYEDACNNAWVAPTVALSAIAVVAIVAVVVQNSSGSSHHSH